MAGRMEMDRGVAPPPSAPKTRQSAMEEFNMKIPSLEKKLKEHFNDTFSTQSSSSSSSSSSPTRRKRHFLTPDFIASLAMPAYLVLSVLTLYLQLFEVLPRIHPGWGEADLLPKRCLVVLGFLQVMGNWLCLRYVQTSYPAFLRRGRVDGRGWGGGGGGRVEEGVRNKTYARVSCTRGLPSDRLSSAPRHIHPADGDGSDGGCDKNYHIDLDSSSQHHLNTGSWSVVACDTDHGNKDDTHKDSDVCLNDGNNHDKLKESEVYLNDGNDHDTLQESDVFQEAENSHDTHKESNLFQEDRNSHHSHKESNLFQEDRNSHDTHKERNLFQEDGNSHDSHKAESGVYPKKENHHERLEESGAFPDGTRSRLRQRRRGRSRRSRRRSSDSLSGDDIVNRQSPWKPAFTPPAGTAFPYWSWVPCYVCEVMRPPRCHHCPVCRTCVLKRDHHCYVAGRCVGWRNQRHFVCFVTWILVGALYTSYNYFFYFRGPLWPELTWYDALLPVCLCRWALGFASTTLTASVVLLSLYFLFFLLAARFLRQQVLLIAKGLTAFEAAAGAERHWEVRDTRGPAGKLRAVFGRAWGLNLVFPLWHWVADVEEDPERWPGVEVCPRQSVDE